MGIDFPHTAWAGYTFVSKDTLMFLISNCPERTRPYENDMKTPALWFEQHGASNQHE
jgi:hypothetical protein